MQLETIHLYPFQWHSLSISLFASVIAPFGGFFASGFKRAFKIKVSKWEVRIGLALIFCFYWCFGNSFRFALFHNIRKHYYLFTRLSNHTKAQHFWVLFASLLSGWSSKTSKLLGPSRSKRKVSYWRTQRRILPVRKSNRLIGYGKN